MAYEPTTVTEANAASTGGEALSIPPMADLSATIQALAQATQALTTTATQMMNNVKAVSIPHHSSCK
jgi:hypothetical protein